ncbi:uncharacterized protein LOC103314234 [Tribolium castaneum]|uniref:DBF4-type domain-containing protein n=1 Tax=Tribolium castaneum TaxID=7070 RepID=D6X2P7_TRICA|nr:PREDICTED: uncharacterized protein LOC103314234 [Tribolium castaneum]XP_008197889.1 PREDICTED: uncharacterized protein LOC103314234 [Tribolium castaneum]XP_008197890.1 PREDICTED: uncharacterized protein LOC103314234 [Tribolium castaneum]XP_008197891.1 PREDICTED: uncharacterized protein LOC103314234 [Tribolium castaneum]XP_008197892.1 PREDICTED: uncharacterized protein LOC103314234 [Tribolium castaneum]EFA09843.2 hypothetical protein TcasGA2_TC011991 [Tribolium castaneum]|eukprot:XP_008197888.1 PREDICTED: uncharacterized protein LOC103314234 [Tribolium castaneum]
MFEKKTRLHVKSLLEKQFDNFRELEQSVKNHLIDTSLGIKQTEKVSSNRSTNERNMTRKTRTRRPRIHSIFESGYCAVCHTPYNSLEEHIQSKRHLKLIGDDGNFISIKGFDTFLALDGIDAIEVNEKTRDYSPPRRRSRMPRTRTSSVMCDRIKDSPMSPVGSDSGHHLRSRKNINYMTPPLEEDSLTEKPEVVKEYRELRSSSRLLAKLADQMVENDEVWNSGRPKRSCNRTRISADERLVVDNKSYYKVEVLSSKLRSGVTHFQEVKRPETPVEKEDDKGLIVKFRKLRSSELVRLNNEAENFLFPKKDETSDDDDDDDKTKNDNSSVSETDDSKVKIEDDESMHSTSSESKKKRRRTHAEAFIMDNQKYYKFETPGSRLRYHGSYLSPVPMKSKNNGDCVVKNESEESEPDKNFNLRLDDYNFSFESVPKNEAWYQTFQRRDKGEEKYVFLSDDNYWDPLILPYQLDYVPPLDPQECVSTYNQIKKCLMEPPSASTSVTCSTPDPNASNSSVETPFNQDEDSKISATEISSNSTLDEIKPSRNKRSRRSGMVVNVTGTGKNPRKSPRQHASTLAILSSLIQQRKRKSRRTDLDFRSNLPTILEEPKPTKSPKKSKVDYFSMMKRVEEEFASACDDNLDVEIEKDEDIAFKGQVGVEDILNVYEDNKDTIVKSPKRLVSAKPGRKPGKRKKNRTGWPLNRSRRMRRKEDDDSTVDSLSLNADSDGCDDTTDSIKKKSNCSENNNQNDQSSLSDVNIGDSNCDLSNADRVKNENRSDDANSVLSNKVTSDGFNIDLQYQPYVRVQKLDKNHIDNKSEPAKRSNSPKRTNRGQRRMPASPKSPRMLRRPRGRWYRER